MAEIGEAANKGQAPGAASVARSMAAARRAPLAVEPFLIAGAIAQSEQAHDARRAAVRRSGAPRSALGGGTVFLAQLYLASGRPGEGLRHASVLVRLVSGGPAALVPAIAQYAKSPGLFRRCAKCSPAIADCATRSCPNWRATPAISA